MRNRLPVTGLVAALLTTGGVWADSVQLKSGAVYEGQIMAEDAYEVRIMVSKTTSGSVKTVKIIDQKLVSRMVRDRPQVAIIDEPGSESDAVIKRPSTAVPSKDGDIAKLERALEKGDDLLAASQFKDAVKLYRRAVEKTESMAIDMRGRSDGEGLSERLRLLTARDRSYRLLIVALEGSRDHLEELVEQNEEEIDTYADETEDMQRELASLERSGRSSGSGKTTIRLGEWSEQYKGSGRAMLLRRELEMRPELLAARRRDLEAEKLSLVKMETEISLAKEKADLAEDERADLERELRSRD